MRHHADPVGITLVVLSAIGFGVNGPVARLAIDAGFNPVTFATWRSVGSVVGLVILLAIGVAIGRTSMTPLSRIGRLEWLQLAAMGLFVAGTTLGLFLAIERTTIALVLIVFYTYPVIVAVAAVPIYGETLGLRRLGAILLASVGMVLLVVGPGADGGRGVDVLGVLFALMAAGCQTGYALVASRGFPSVPAIQSATILRAFSLAIYVLFLVPFVLLIGEAEHLVGPLGSPGAWGLIAVAAILGAALPTAGLVEGYRRVGPTRGAVLMLLEPVTGVLLAGIWLSERPAPVQLVGGLLVLAGAALVQLAPGTRSEVVARPSGE